MLPATLQFLITMIACAIIVMMQRKLDYTQEEVRVLKGRPPLYLSEFCWMRSVASTGGRMRRRPA